MDNYQQRVMNWSDECFGGLVNRDPGQRVERFFEEVAELAQALCLPDWAALAMVKYEAVDFTTLRALMFRSGVSLCRHFGMANADLEKLVNYVYGRPVGELKQEMGGVMVTLALLCEVNGKQMADMQFYADLQRIGATQGVNCRYEGERELERIMQPDVMRKVRAKQMVKPKTGVLQVTA